MEWSYWVDMHSILKWLYDYVDGWRTLMDVVTTGSVFACSCPSWNGLSIIIIIIIILTKLRKLTQATRVVIVRVLDLPPLISLKALLKGGTALLLLTSIDSRRTAKRRRVRDVRRRVRDVQKRYMHSMPKSGRSKRYTNSV